MKKNFSSLLLLTALFFYSAIHAQNTSPYWSLAGNNNANAGSILGTLNNNPLRLYANSSLRALIATNGNFGIGTATPQQRFHVEGISNQAIFVSTSAPGAISGSGQIGYMKALPTAAGNRLGYFLLGSRGGAEFNYNVAGMIGYAGAAWTASSRPAYLAFETTAPGNTTRAERVRIAPNGFVGIGTTSPANELHVVGRGRLTNGLSVEENGIYSVHTTGNGVEGYGNTTYGFGLYGSGAYGVGGSGVYGLYGTSTSTSGYGAVTYGGYGGTYGSASQYGIYGYSANYGVYGYTPGTTEGSEGRGVQGYCASYGLGVAGYSQNGSGVYGQSGTYYAGWFDGNVYSTGSYVGSDSKLKQNITDLSNAMDILNKLQPKSYDFRQDGNFKYMHLPKGKHFGLIAQELEQVLPSLVRESKFDTKNAIAKGVKEDPKNTSARQPATGEGEIIEFKAVNYTELIPVMVKAMQEQQQQIEKQQKQNEELLIRIDKLENLLNKMTNGQGINTSLSGAALLQNTPNPVRGSTVIKYSLPEGAGRGQLLLTDALGRTVKAFQLTSSGVVNVDVSGLSSGVYNYSLLVDGKTLQTKKLTVTR